MFQNLLDLFDNFPENYKQVIKGVIYVLVALFMPRLNLVILGLGALYLVLGLNLLSLLEPKKKSKKKKKRKQWKNVNNGTNVS